jgi:FkbM family methyltransferase
MRTLLKQAAHRGGLDLRRRRNVPFGIDWTADLAYYLSGPLKTAFDIGANVGQTARRLAAQFPDAKIHSFEPLPDTYRQLEQNTAGMNVRCVNAAAGDTTGPAAFGLGGDSGRNGFQAAHGSVTVNVVTLDDYAAEQSLSQIGLLKIDTEGHESAVLRGARGLLEAGRVDNVLCECEFVRRPDEPHGDFMEIAGMLLPLGYQVVSFYTGGVDDLGWRWGDVLFTRPGETSGRVVCSPHQ